MNGLLPCPFCGGEANFYENWIDHERKWSVSCGDCPSNLDSCEDTKTEAAERWNTRAVSSAQDAARWTLQESVPSDGFECFYILKDGLQIAEVSGPQSVENTKNLQELVDAANAGQPAAFDPLADLVARFAAALLEKLRAAEKKYGWTDAWMQDDWQESCQRQFFEHVQKGDPRDVANYCAFMWHHGWSTAPHSPAACDDAGDAATLRGFIKEHGCTPSMVASDRDHWKRRAEQAEAQVESLTVAVAAAHAAFQAIPIGYPLQQNGRTIDHTLLNVAKELCERAPHTSTVSEYKLPGHDETMANLDALTIDPDKAFAETPFTRQFKKDAEELHRKLSNSPHVRTPDV